MKLKKIAALALAGVMAVSMLAGCAGKGTDDKKDPTTGTNAAYTQVLVDALKANETVKAKKNLTVTAGTGLQTTLDAAAKVPGMNIYGIQSYMTAVDSSLKTDLLPGVQGTNTSAVYKDDSSVLSVFGITSVSDSGVLQESVAIKSLVDKILAAQVSKESTATISGLSDHSSDYTDTVNKEQKKFHFTYAYTLEVSVAPIKAADGKTTYVCAYELTRTPTRVEGEYKAA